MSNSGPGYPGGGRAGDVQLIDQRSNRELITGSVIATLSLVVVAGVAFVLLGSPTGTRTDTRASILPAINALLNGTSAALLTVGYICIRRKKVIAHKTCMATAFVVSSLFLVTYLIHHYRVGAVPFAGEGWLRAVYFSVLIPHVVLAALVVPLALTTIYHGVISRFDKHRPNRQVDTSNMAIRVGKRCPGVLDAVLARLTQRPPQTGASSTSTGPSDAWNRDVKGDGPIPVLLVFLR